MRDLRDPSVLGKKLLELKRSRRFSSLSRTYNRCMDELHAVPVFHDPRTSLERYGDPVAQHKAKIAAGLAVELP